MPPRLDSALPKPLAAGQTLSFYEILGPLGAGGMGEVYLAKDTRLDREVAIKVLPEELADDLDRLRRFEREAKTLASLNQPNVAGIHGIDLGGDTCFLAMELVPGEDLEKRLQRGALQLDEALDVCRQIAEGLEAAHEAGVVHRDLKPGNVRITPEGAVKILDFGLAKPIGPKAPNSGMPSAQSDSFLVTSEGMILGTPTYMSPEQARGKPVDRRTDIWAFGCVLFECLTGKRAFGGDAFGDLIVAILEHEVDLDALPPETPPHLRRLIRRALIKDPRMRLGVEGVLWNPRLSHDSKQLAFDRTSLRTSGDVWVRDLLRGTEVRLTEASSDDSAPVWTPGDDGIYFHITPDLYYAKASGVGAVERILKSVGSKVPLNLSADGRTLLWSVEESGVLSALDLETLESRPLFEQAEDARLSPDGAWLAVEVRVSTELFVALQTYPGGDHFTRISSGASRTPRWAPAGDEILFDSEGEIVAVPVELPPGAAPVPGESRVIVPRAGPDDYLLRRGFEITPDGQRLLLVRSLMSNAGALTVLENALPQRL